MGIGQASGVAAALCAIQNVEPRKLDPSSVQQALIQLGASVFRDEKAKSAEEAHANQCVKEFIQSHREFVSKPSVVHDFREKLGVK